MHRACVSITIDTLVVVVVVVFMHNMSAATRVKCEASDPRCISRSVGDALVSDG